MAPQLMHLVKRSTGARVGLGAGIAVACIIVILVITFMVVHTSRSRRIAAVDREMALHTAEEKSAGENKYGRLGSESSDQSPKRSKSVREKLMEPIYRSSTIHLMPVSKPKAAHVNGQHAQNRTSALSVSSNRWSNLSYSAFLQKYRGTDSPRPPSYSDKRATRMMMMM